MDCPTINKFLANVVWNQKGRVRAYEARDTCRAFVRRRGCLRNLVGRDLGHDDRCNVPDLALSY